MGGLAGRVGGVATKQIGSAAWHPGAGANEEAQTERRHHNATSWGRAEAAGAERRGCTVPGEPVQTEGQATWQRSRARRTRQDGRERGGLEQAERI